MGNNRYADESGRETADRDIVATREDGMAAEVAREVIPDDKTVSDRVIRRKESLGIEGAEPRPAAGENRELREAEKRIHELGTENAFKI